jgi:hypothetical protein
MRRRVVIARCKRVWPTEAKAELNNHGSHVVLTKAGCPLA